MASEQEAAMRAAARDSMHLWELAMQQWKAAVGVGLYCSLTTFAVQYPMHLPISARNSLQDALPFSMLPTVIYALTFLLAAGLFARWHIAPKGTRYLLAITAMPSAGMLFVLAIEAFPSMFVWVFGVTGCVLVSAGTALLGIEWMRALAQRGALATLLCIAFSSFLVAGVFLLVSCLPQWSVSCLASLLPWVSMACLDYPRSKKAALLRDGSSTPIRVPWKAMFTLFIQGVAAGMVQMLSDGVVGIGYLPIQALALIVASVLVLGAALALRLDFNQLIYEVGFPLMAFGFLALATFPSWVSAGIVVHEVGNRFVMMLAWALAAWIIAQEDLSANWVYPCIMVAYLAGRLLGVGAGLLVGLPVGALSVTMVFVVLMASVVALGGRGGETGWGAFRMAAKDDLEGDDPLEAACRMIAKSAKLTPRETEIALLLARGRNRSYICEACVISSDTVKSHMRNIYRKMGVHSQQELMTVVEEVRDTLDDPASRTRLTILAE